MKQAVGHLHDVVFGEARHLLAAVAAGKLERIADDALGAGARDQLEGLIDLARLAVLDTGVQVFLVLADDDDIYIRILGRYERVIADDRAHVGEQAERLAQGDVDALEATALRRGQRRFVHHAGAKDRIERLLCDAGQRAGEVDALTEHDLLRFDLRAGFGQDMQAGVHNFGADTVAAREGNRDFVGHQGRVHAVVCCRNDAHCIMELRCFQSLAFDRAGDGNSRDHAS